MIMLAHRPPRFACVAEALAAIAAAQDTGALGMLWSRSLMRSKRAARAYAERKATLCAVEAAANAARGDDLWGDR
jgi:hypothetical protein